jgi:hypothetical protein
MDDLSRFREVFTEEGFVLVPDVLARERIVELVASFRAAEAEKRITPLKNSDRFRVEYYAVDVFEQLMLDMIGLVKRVVGADLWPTYSLVRTYQRGASLPPHRDRGACEITASLTLESGLVEPWPIFVRGRAGTPSPLVAKIGDFVLMRGAEFEHWRETLAGDWQTQVFLHYVRRAGPHARFLFDRRPGLTLAKPVTSG